MRRGETEFVIIPACRNDFGKVSTVFNQPWVRWYVFEPDIGTNV